MNKIVLTAGLVIVSIICFIGFAVIATQKNPKGYSILSVQTSGDTRVTKYAMALAESPRDIPVDGMLLENVLADHREMLPEYITDVVVKEDGFFSNGKYIEELGYELVLRKNDKVLLVFETTDNTVHYAYMKYRPTEYSIVLPDGSYPGPDSVIDGYLYRGADLLTYPVLTMRTFTDENGISRTSADYSTENIRVTAERVGYIPDHHRTFKNQHGR